VTDPFVVMAPFNQITTDPDVTFGTNVPKDKFLLAVNVAAVPTLGPAAITTQKHNTRINS